MNDLEINIAIAGMCGWGFLSKDKFIVIPPNSPNSVQPLSTIPDYVNDLNAMHEAEEMLTDDQWVEYRENIRTVVLGPVRYVSQWCKADIHSTARQRAEAFLRTVGKWKEAKP